MLYCGITITDLELSTPKKKECVQSGRLSSGDIRLKRKPCHAKDNCVATCNEAKAWDNVYQVVRDAMMLDNEFHVARM